METTPSCERVMVRDVNDHVICRLCGGYLVDATTVTRCLHSYCRSCIVRHLAEDGRCPRCGPDDPQNVPGRNRIRRDRILQRLTYKMVPGLLNSELNRRRDFETASEQHAPGDQGRASSTSYVTSRLAGMQVFTGSEMFNVRLQMLTEPESGSDVPSTDAGVTTCVNPRFLLCPALLTIRVLKKFLRLKFDLRSTTQVEIIMSDEILDCNHTLMDVVYIFKLPPNEPMTMSYVIGTLPVGYQLRPPTPCQVPTEQPPAADSACAMDVDPPVQLSPVAAPVASDGDHPETSAETDNNDRTTVTDAGETTNDPETNVDVEQVTPPKKKRGRKPKRRGRPPKSGRTPGSTHNVSGMSSSSTDISSPAVATPNFYAESQPTPLPVGEVVKKKRGRKPKPRPEVGQSNPDATSAAVASTPVATSQNPAENPPTVAVEVQPPPAGGADVPVAPPVDKPEVVNEVPTSLDRSGSTQDVDAPVVRRGKRKRKSGWNYWDFVDDDGPSERRSPQRRPYVKTKIRLRSDNAEQTIWKVTSSPSPGPTPNSVGVVPRIKVTSVRRQSDVPLPTVTSPSFAAASPRRRVGRPKSTWIHSRRSLGAVRELKSTNVVPVLPAAAVGPPSNRKSSDAPIRGNHSFPVPLLERAEWFQRVPRPPPPPMISDDWNGPMFPTMEPLLLGQSSTTTKSLTMGDATSAATLNTRPMSDFSVALPARRVPTPVARRTVELATPSSTFTTPVDSPPCSGRSSGGGRVPTGLAVATDASEVMFVVAGDRRLAAALPRMVDLDGGHLATSHRVADDGMVLSAGQRLSTSCAHNSRSFLPEHCRGPFVTKRVSVQKDGTVLLDQRGESVVLVSTIPSAYILSDQLHNDRTNTARSTASGSSLFVTTADGEDVDDASESNRFRSVAAPPSAPAVGEKTVPSPDRRSDDCFEITSTVADEPPAPSVSPVQTRLLPVCAEKQNSVEDTTQRQPTPAVEENAKESTGSASTVSVKVKVESGTVESDVPLPGQPVTSVAPTPAVRPSAKKKSLEMVVSQLQRRPQQSAAVATRQPEVVDSRRMVSTRPPAVTSGSTSIAEQCRRRSVDGSIVSTKSSPVLSRATPTVAPPFEAASRLDFRLTDCGNATGTAVDFSAPPIKRLKNMCSNVRHEVTASASQLPVQSIGHYYAPQQQQQHQNSRFPLGYLQAGSRFMPPNVASRPQYPGCRPQRLPPPCSNVGRRLPVTTAMSRDGGRQRIRSPSVVRALLDSPAAAAAMAAVAAASSASGLQQYNWRQALHPGHGWYHASR